MSDRNPIHQASAAVPKSNIRRRAVERSTTSSSTSATPTSSQGVANSPATSPALVDVNTILASNATGKAPINSSGTSTRKINDKIGWIGGLVVSILAIAILVGCCIRYLRIRRRKMLERAQPYLWSDGLGEPKETSEKHKNTNKGDNVTPISTGPSRPNESKEPETKRPGSSRSRIIEFGMKALSPRPPLDVKMMLSGGEKKELPVDTFQMELTQRARRSKVTPPLPAAVIKRDTSPSMRFEHNDKPGLYADLTKIAPAEFNENQMRVSYPLQTYGHLESPSSLDSSRKNRKIQIGSDHSTL